MSLDLVETLKTVPAILIGLTLHEGAHAWTAHRLGDPSAKLAGRLSLNPLRHIDPVGFLLIVLAGFGWAKPVTFNPANLKKPHRDEILIALAGPFSNLLLGLGLLVLARGLYALPLVTAASWGLETIQLLILWAMIQFGLFVFNLIPIPPLDGSHLYMTYLSGLKVSLLQAIYRWSLLGLMAIILAQNFLHWEILPLTPMIRGLTQLFLQGLQF